MKRTRQILRALIFSYLLILSCNKDDNTIAMVEDPVQIGDPQNPDVPDEPDTPTSGQFQMVDIMVSLPGGSDIEVSSTTVFTLASQSKVTTAGTGNLPFNPGTGQLTYLIDAEDNLLLAGFLTDNRKEISVATTAEVLLYFGLGYHLLPDNVKLPYIDAVQQVKGYANFVTEIENLFESNPLMYTEGTYESVLNAKIDEISFKETIDITARIEVDSRDTRSGITISDVDASNIQVQNSYPRRAHTFVYKKSSTDLGGNETQIPNYRVNPIADFKIESGGRDSGFQDSSISIQQQCTVAAQSNIENTTISEPINLPVSEDELSAEYEVVVVGPGTGPTGNGRDFTPAERAKFEELSKEAFILDNFLPTLLDIGGNKGLLPPFGDSKEGALVNAILPYLEANPDILAKVLDNDFDAASKEFIPFLYKDIRQSNDLRELLKNVYEVVDGGNFPNTFIQSQELIETGEARYKALTRIIDRNINSYDNKCNNYRMDDTAQLERWNIKSSEGKVKVGPECLNILFDKVGDITVNASADLESGQTLEYDWSTSGEFGGRIQDINGDSSNFGTNITNTQETVSFSSVALDSDLGDGDNIENVTVTAFVKNADGSRSEVGSDQMKVNILKRTFVITPDEVCINGGRNVVLRVRHTDGQKTIPDDNFDYKLVWRTAGKYGKLSGRNTVETKYNDNLIFYHSQDEEIDRGDDQVFVTIYARPKDGSGGYTMVDSAEATVTTKNDPDCKFELYPIQFSEVLIDTSTDCTVHGGDIGSAWSGRTVIKVPKDENATRYTVVWNEVTSINDQGNIHHFNQSSRSWTNESIGPNDEDDGFNFKIYSGVGAGASCSNHPAIPEMKARLQGVRGYATVTVCYD